MKSKLVLFLMLGAGLTLALWAQESPKPLSRYQLVELLANGVPSERVAALVQQRSIDFEPPDGRLIKHARYYWLLLAESHLTRRLFGSMVGRIASLPQPAG